MKYYRYVGKLDTVMTLKIHEMLQKYKPLAMAKYKSNWEDALDDAYFHILEHFDVSQGSLEHYVHKIVDTIYLNRYSSDTSKEIDSDTVLDIESSKYAVKQDMVMNPYNSILSKIEDVEYGVNLNNCIQYLLPYFIKDYELFHSRDGSVRKMNYNGLFDKFPAGVIGEAVKKLSDEYYDDAKYIGTLSKSCHARNFSADRYKSSLDKTISYISRIGDIVKCKVIGSKRQKYVYHLDISDLLDKIFIMFYDEEGLASRKIYKGMVYCSLSGQVLFSKDELRDTLEREIIGSILAMRTNLKVLHYVKGTEILFTSTNEDEPSVILTMFKTGIYIPLTRLTMGKSENKQSRIGI